MEQQTIAEIVQNLVSNCVGMVGAPTRMWEVPLILLEGLEGVVRDEDLVIIHNNIEPRRYLLAVCREGKGTDANLGTGEYSPSIAYVKTKGVAPPPSRRVFSYKLKILGEITEKGLVTNRRLIGPGSRVYSIAKSRGNPLQLLSGETCVTSGHYWQNENWAVPLDKRYIPYHLAVFGSTGSGKSCLVNHMILPALKKAGYNALIFDWEGLDYCAVSSRKVLNATELAVSGEVVVGYILDKAENFGYSARSPIEDYLIELLEKKDDWRKWPREEFLANLEAQIKAKIHGKGDVERSKTLQKELMRVELGLSKIKEMAVPLGTVTAGEILEMVKQEKEVVINLSGLESTEKLTVFLEIAREVLLQMHQGKDLGLSLVVDEAAQYCPYKPTGVQVETTNIIRDLCATGRKHKVSLVLVSQGIAGEIGINSAVRRNLNTQFFGKLHPLDLGEANLWLGSYGIQGAQLLLLDPGQFYFVGKMNPSPTPLLISFQLR